MNENDQFWMVWNPERSVPTHRHGDEDFAVREAERLARANPGQRFYVLHATDLRVVDAMQRVKLGEPEMPF